jgi:hypothetical protein
MRRSADRTALVGFLQGVLGISLAGAIVMLLVAAVLRGFGTARAQVLLTFVGLFFGSLLMQVQLRARRRAERGVSTLLAIGVAVILISQISFLVLVWTNWKTATFVWRIWWVSMVPSVFVTHLILLRGAAGRHGNLVELLTGFCVLWAGLMILYLGLRRDMLAGISPAYLWVGAVPAAGTVLGSVYVVTRRALRRARPGAASKRATVAGVLMSLLVTAVAGFYVGRATAGRGRQLSEDPNALIAAAGKDLLEQLGKDKYGIQARVATFLGDTRIVRRPPFIGIDQIEKLQSRLRPGDILLERRNWYLSNPALPGFWPHAALYIGHVEDLKRLGVTNHPSFRKHLGAYFTAAPDGRGNTVIEAVSEGVILNSLTHSLHADYAAVLRPRLSEKQVAAAIVRAFEHLGKPYDFNFDFDDTDKLVCTQLIYVSYAGMVNFPLQRVMGRSTLPANEIARKYAAEAGRADRQLDFVLFLDAAPARGVAFEADEAAFRESLKRPRALVERP